MKEMRCCNTQCSNQEKRCYQLHTDTPCLTQMPSVYCLCQQTLLA